MKRTKIKLISSITILIVCFAMLIGSTFAWFTDSASTGVNKIQAGNLDIEVLHSNAFVTEAQDIQDVKNMFLNSRGEEMSWEPGAVSYEIITVSNKGDLALKYSLTFNVSNYNTVISSDGTNTNKSLLDVLKVIVKDDPLTTVTKESVSELDWANAPTLSSFAKENRELYPSTDYTEGHKNKETFQLIVYWPQSSNDNDYNLQNGKYASDSNSTHVGNLFIKMGINIDATQLVSEYDSFGNNYDKDALLPEISITEAVKTGGNYTLDNGTYTNSNNETVPVPQTVISSDTSFYPAHASEDAISQQEDGNLSRKLETTVNENSSTVNINVTFSYTTSSSTTEVKKFSKIVENIAEIEKNLEIDNVTHEGNLLTMVSERPNENNRVDQTYYYDSTNGLLYFYSTKFSNFEVSYIKYWKDFAAEELDIDTESKIIEIGSAEELALLANNINSNISYGGYTVILTNDISLDGKRWTPIKVKNGVANNFVLDGDGHTITGLKIIDYKDTFLRTYTGLFETFGGTIKNLTMKNSYILGERSGVLIGASNKDITIENVKVIDATIKSEQKNGGLIGYVRSTDNVGTSTVNIKDCIVENVVFETYKQEDPDAPWQCGAIWGYSDSKTIATVENNYVNNITIINDPNEAYGKNNSQYASNPFVGNVVNYMVGDKKLENYNMYPVVFNNNRIGDNQGFFYGNYSHTYIGSYFPNVINGYCATKLTVDGRDLAFVPTE